MTKSSPTTPSPETITLEVRISMYKFCLRYKHSDHSSNPLIIEDYAMKTVLSMGRVRRLPKTKLPSYREFNNTS
jgi:hypothetical protein